MQKYKALALDDDNAVLELIVDCLKLAKCDVAYYSQAETLLSAISNLHQKALPDLIVLDLNLQPGKMQGIQLLAELFDRDVPSEILVMSGAGVMDLEGAIRMGAAVISKPFDGIYQLVKKMELLADTGRRRRLYRLQTQNRLLGMDDSARSRKPVFLSYAEKNNSFATGIRRNLEARKIRAWYAPSALEIGDAWRSRIEKAIDQCDIFVAILTEGYVASPFCIAELTRFHRRIVPGRKRPVILPVLAGLSEDSKKHDLVRSILENYQCVDISVRFLDRATALLGRIEALLGEQVYRRDGLSRGASAGS